ncbi:Transcriptional regulator, MarR family OS=Tsukamurella paurometabola (strain ATCC 8368 / DSM/ CCUG 35730 / CIP 100753 / JCM 10117 / KCTC 9821 / NBRC 16120/ NCIMB 702349 / NCTC 13040) OX=521096 GN=Tpau_1826 PE=4 SV=1 [Tsukamurella paurometabola]|uniref:Transcriptional regulator, MarR family n=1 Tax=Tsukamurella paurometabola (strain ATCC 8368 / DSM 20162 / CCUG 35730 / CIP 100753 / JCM 10117 / KCTC 9821 / NBRC 16120 / NCIMB 702349 / NCTC 13040) TaxID=521096 RepID=D5UMU7_TSUPD|nr:MarR family transcriptional regulator [Tsukamurella paurometabola]ADG78444.1 transcriptional regulator, MarR family [Tsukamurella paurometabola DSM 20162]SUP31656.1 MarR family [Tsukamurella paurometabola]
MSRNEHLIHALRDAALRWNREIAAFGRVNDLGETDIRALIALLDLERAHTAATPGALAAQLGLSSAACTALVDRLVASSLVERAPDAADRRRVRLVVTDSARRLGEDFFAGFLGPLRSAAAGLDAEEAAAVQRFLAAAVQP